jgi:hypothetical protein
MISPAVRRAFHQALDLVLDAMNEDAAANDNAAKRKRRPPTPAPLPPLPADLTPEELEQSDARLAKAGYRRRA